MLALLFLDKHRNTQPSAGTDDHIERLLQSTLPPQQLAHMQNARIRNLQLEMRKMQGMYDHQATQLRDALVIIDATKQHTKHADKEIKVLKDGNMQLQARVQELESLLHAKEAAITLLTKDKQQLVKERCVMCKEGILCVFAVTIQHTVTNIGVAWRSSCSSGPCSCNGPTRRCSASETQQ